MKYPLPLVACWTVLGCSSLPPRSITFQEAKRGDEARKLEFLDQLLGRLVYDKDRNPAGTVKAWYYMAGAIHKDSGCHCGACGREALREEFLMDVREMTIEMHPNAVHKILRKAYRKDVREMSFEEELPKILKTLESPACRLMPFYRLSAPMGRKKCQGILLVGDLFGLTNEEELRSAFDDYLLTYAKDREDGMVFKDEWDNEYEMIFYSPDMSEIAHASLINLHARSVQIEKIASRVRKVSLEYRQAVVGDYLVSHRLFSRHYAIWKDIYDGNRNGSLIPEIMDFLVFMKKLIHGNLKKVGLEHREVDGKTFEYSLVGFP